MPGKPKRKSAALRHALIVSAHSGTRRVCRQVLKTCGFSVGEAESGVAAVAAAREQAPDIIFLAPQLRDVPGDEALTWLRPNPQLGAVPIVVMISHRGSPTAAVERDAAAVLRKPISPVAVRHAIESVLPA